MKKFYLFVIIMVIFLLDVTMVSAATPTFPNKAKFTRGVKNTCYYVDSTARTYLKYIKPAAISWASLKNNIKNTAVASKAGTHIDFYQNTSTIEGLLGVTLFYDSKGNMVTGYGSEPSVNYNFTRIYLNKNNASYIYTKTIIHEMGHAYGLAHSLSRYSIMYPDKTSYVSTPSSDDNATINILYP